MMDQFFCRLSHFRLFFSFAFIFFSSSSHPKHSINFYVIATDKNISIGYPHTHTHTLNSLVLFVSRLNHSFCAYNFYRCLLFFSFVRERTLSPLSLRLLPVNGHSIAKWKNNQYLKWWESKKEKEKMKMTKTETKNEGKEKDTNNNGEKTSSSNINFNIAFLSHRSASRLLYSFHCNLQSVLNFISNIKELCMNVKNIQVCSKIYFMCDGV